MIAKRKLRISWHGPEERSLRVSQRTREVIEDRAFNRRHALGPWGRRRAWRTTLGTLRMSVFSGK